MRGACLLFFYAFGLLFFGAISDIIGQKIVIVWGMFGAAALLFSSVAFYDTLERSFESAQVLRMIGLLGAILSLFTGKLIERIKTSGTLLLGMSIGIVSLLFMLYFKEEIIFLVTILFISSIALLIPTIVTKIGILTGELRVKALSMYSFILLIGATFAPLLVIHLSFQQVLILLIGFYTVNLFLIQHE